MMKNKEAKELANEYNETLVRGRELWAEMQPLAKRCSDIINTLRDNKVRFDEIALIFGGELEIDFVGDDDEEVQ